MADLPDVNVWVALSAGDHPLYSVARDYWRKEAPSSVVFCRVTMLGLTRNLCGQASANATPFAPLDAWQVYRRWCEAPGIVMAPDPDDIEEHLFRLYESGLVTRRVSTDAYLAAFAIAADLRLVTFDKDFERFPGLDLLLL